MNAINHLRRISPLALVLVALAAVLALTPAAHAQSTQTVMLHPNAPDTSRAATARTDGTVGLVKANKNDFRQRWLREKISVSPVKYRFVNAVTNQCMRVPTGLAINASDSVVLGSCSGLNAQWRPSGQRYIAGTGHYMAAGFCLGTPGCVERIDAMQPDFLSIFEPLTRWSVTIL
jgi:hypothetical protein